MYAMLMMMTVMVHLIGSNDAIQHQHPYHIVYQIADYHMIVLMMTTMTMMMMMMKAFSYLLITALFEEVSAPWPTEMMVLMGSMDECDSMALNDAMILMIMGDVLMMTMIHLMLLLLFERDHMW
jgi:hypothetical protein